MSGKTSRQRNTSGPVSIQPIDGGMAMATRPLGTARSEPISRRALPTRLTTPWA